MKQKDNENKKQRFFFTIVAVVSVLTVSGCETTKLVNDNRSYINEDVVIPSYQQVGRGQYASGNQVYTTTSVATTYPKTWVDTRNYENMRRSVLAGRNVPKPIYLEEWLNYFDYNYPKPKNGAAFYVNTEVGPAPWNKRNRLIQIGIQGIPAQESLQPINLIFVVDVSSAMNTPAGIPLVQQMLYKLEQSLRKQDNFTVITMSEQPQVLFSRDSNNDVTSYINKLSSVTSSKAISLEHGLTAAYNYIDKHPVNGAINQIVLLSSANSSLNGEKVSRLRDLVNRKRKQGIVVSTMMFSDKNYDVKSQQALADIGGGFHEYVDTINKSHRIVNERLMVDPIDIIAQNMQIAVTFDPSYVGRYRLLGFDDSTNQRLSRDPAVTDQIHSGYSYTLLYEVSLTNKKASTTSKTAPGIVVLPDELGKVEITYRRGTEPFPYRVKAAIVPKQVQDSFSTTSSDFNLAAAVAALALKLNNDVYLEDLSLDNIKSLLKMTNTSDPQSKTAELLEIMDKIH